MPVEFNLITTEQNFALFCRIEEASADAASKFF